MTVYDMVVSDLGLPVVNQFSDHINRIINSTRAVMLRFLRRRDWPEELDEILCSASVSYFTRKYPDYASGDTTAAAETPEIASISDNGQTVSYRAGAESVSEAARAAGLDDVIGRYYGTLILYRRAWL
jgi:hypothetical protein|nr:MAG TPA: hypothetical protein [Caudoviricetes sp.]